MELLYLETVDSTNKYAKEHLSELDDMTLVYAGTQTAGRGRLERKWSFTGEENIYATFILKPSSELKENYSNLTQYLCVVLAEVFESYGVAPKIKWPNDIQINGKKISGILAESVINHGKLEGIVLGFGVNLNCSPETLDKINQPATALNIETGFSVKREEFIRNIIDKFCLRYNKFIEEGFLLIKNDYVRRAGFLNKPVKLRVFDKNFCGIAKSIDDKGALILLDENNEEHVFLIGDIL